MNKILSFFFLILAFCILITSCRKISDIGPTNDSFLIFGHFYGECGGESCVEIYRLNSNELLEFTDDHYPMGDKFYESPSVSLPYAKFKGVSDLWEYFPSALLDEADIVIGTPDAGDWGGIYVEYSASGIHKFWLIDKMDSNVPEYLHEFVHKIEDKIEFINN